MSEPISAENYEQSLSVFAVYGVSAFSNHSLKNENLSFTTDVNYDLITVNSTEEEINSFYFYKEEEDRITCTLIPGDGVGPDLVKSVRQVFDAASIPIDFETYHLSEVDTMGSATLDEVARSIRKNRIALKGILAYPDKSQSIEVETMNMKLRKKLDLFANVVHIQSLEGIHCRHSNINIDTIIIREQTEGEYTALEHESVKGVVECLKIVTAVKSRKIAKFAFDYATYLNRKKVTAVHKANIMKLGDGLFLKSCDEMAKLYPKLKYEKMIIDNCTMQLVSRPQQFDVLLTPNLYGNIIDNLAAGLVGGAGLVAGSSYSKDCVVFEPTEQFTILWILFVMIVLGNSAVLLTLSLNKRRKSRMNFFIKQLAIADLTVGLLSVLTDIIWRMTVAWYAGNIACKLIRFLQATVTYSSTYVLVALSIDRYDAITHPMNFTGSWRRARILVISAWMISFLFSIPEIYLFEEKPIEGQLQCWIELQPWQWRVYMTLITIALLVMPAIIISACYTVIVRTIWSKSKLLVPPPINDYQLSNSRRRQSNTSNRTVVYRYEDHDTRRASSRGIIPKAKIKTVKMTFVIVFDTEINTYLKERRQYIHDVIPNALMLTKYVIYFLDCMLIIVFILCWSPYIVFNLLQVYGQIPRTQTTTAIATLIQSLVPLNSAANPLIYCLFSTRTCRTLRKLFPLKWLSGCPGFEAGSSHCLGGSDTSSRTVTTSLTQHSSRRSTSANQHTIRIQTNNPTVNSRHCKVAISVV